MTTEKDKATMVSGNNPINDGGLAFPDPARVTGHCGEVGMTLLDYFAAKAMQGLLAAQIHGFNDHPANGPLAGIAYDIADAMLRARSNYHDGGS